MPASSALSEKNLSLRSISELQRPRFPRSWISACSGVVIVKLVVLNRIDKAEGQRPAGFLGQLHQTGDRLAPTKEGSIAEPLVGRVFRQAVCVDDRRVVAD